MWADPTGVALVAAQWRFHMRIGRGWLPPPVSGLRADSARDGRQKGYIVCTLVFNPPWCSFVPAYADVMGVRVVLQVLLSDGQRAKHGDGPAVWKRAADAERAPSP